MSRGADFIKQFIILGFGNVVPKALRLFTLPIMTACLTKAEYGIYDLAYISVTLFIPMATLQMQAASFRYLVGVRNRRDEQEKYITNILLFTLFSSTVALIILFCCLYKLYWVDRLLIVVYYFASVTLYSFQQIARGLGKNKYYSVSVITNSACELLMVFIFLQCLDMGLTGGLSAAVFAAMAGCACLFFSLKIYNFIVWSRLSKAVVAEMLGYSLPLVPDSLSSWLSRLANRFIVTFFMGVEANGIYAVANKLPNIFSLVQGTSQLAWQENATLASQDSDASEYYSKMFHLNFRFLIGVLALLIACTPWLFKLLIRGNYDEAYLQIPILFIGVFFSCVSSFMGGIYVAKMRTKAIAITTVIAAAINIALCMAFTPLLGLYAASYSVCISQLALVLQRMRGVKKLVQMKYKYGELIGLFVVIVVMCVLCYMRNDCLNLLNVVIAIVFSYTANRAIVGRLFAKYILRRNE